MDLRPHIDNIHRQLVVAAEAGGEEARSLADRLTAPLDAAVRLTLQDVLAEAAEEITCELAPGSVELRLRGRDPEFVVNPPPVSASDANLTEGGPDQATTNWPVGGMAPPPSPEADEGGMARINLRMPDHLKAQVEQAAAAEGLSVNAWLVRAAAAAVDASDPMRRRARRAPMGGQHYVGWVR